MVLVRTIILWDLGIYFPFHHINQYDDGLFIQAALNIKKLGGQKITNLGKFPSEQKRKTPKRQKKNKNHKRKLPSQKGKFPSIRIIKYDNIF